MVGGTRTESRTSARTVALRIPSELGWERVAVDAAAGVAARLGFPTERVEDVKTAVAEATLNAIEHGNAGDTRQTVLIVLVPTADTLQISVRDRAFRPLPQRADHAEPPPLAEQIAGRAAPRGWGLYLITALVDEVEFATTRTGNRVRMVLRRES